MLALEERATPHVTAMSAWNFVLKSAELFQGKNNAVN